MLLAFFALSVLSMANEIADLLQSSRPFLTSISKAKAAKLGAPNAGFASLSDACLYSETVH